jgi:hypothetical protein
MASFFSRRHLLLGGAGLAGTALVMKWDALGLPGRQASSSPHEAVGASAGVDDYERKYAQQRADLCGAGNAVGVGLKGEYFADTGMTGPVLLSRVDRFVDFDGQFDWPADQSARPQSARWSGWIKPPLAGKYRFHADAPGMKVMVANQFVAGDGAPADAAVAMALGRFYPITIEARRLDPAFAGRWRLEWTAPHGMRYVVPTALLFMPVIPTNPAAAR